MLERRRRRPAGPLAEGPHAPLPDDELLRLPVDVIVISSSRGGATATPWSSTDAAPGDGGPGAGDVAGQDMVDPVHLLHRHLPGRPGSPGAGGRSRSWALAPIMEHLRLATHTSLASCCPVSRLDLVCWRSWQSMASVYIGTDPLGSQI